MILQVQFLGVLNEFSYLLGQAFGGAILPPYSEAFGRKKLYIVATFLFYGFCIVVGAVPHIAAIVVGRFALGVLSAVAYVVAGSIEDMFNSGPRIWMVYIWIVSANLGLCAGPIIAVYITVKAGWYASSIEAARIDLITIAITQAMDLLYDGYSLSHPWVSQVGSP